MERTEAEKYFPYIAHSYRPITGLEGKLWNWAIGKAYGSVEVKGKKHLEAIPPFPRQGPEEPVFLHAQRHRSELDYIITLITLHNHGLFALTQAGHNLFIGPFDTFIKNRGGFKVYRIQEGGFKRVYDPHWFKNWIQKKKADLEMSVKTPAIFTKEIYRDVYLEYLGTQTGKGYDILVYPGFEQSLGVKKLGRSKTGALNEFSPVVFGAFMKGTTDRPLYIMPSNVSYERVLEDTSIGRIKDIKKRHGTKLAYAYDFYSIIRKARGTASGPRSAISFGEPIEIDQKRLKSSHRYSLRLAKKAREEVGGLETVYPTQIIAYSALQPNLWKDWLSRIRELVHLGKKESLPGRIEISYRELRASYEKNARRLSRRISLENLEGFEKDLARTFEVFGRERIIDDVIGKLIVMDVPVFSQYANHILHLF